MRLEVDQRALEQTLQIALTELKIKKPELFYITGTEQITKLATHINNGYYHRSRCRFPACTTMTHDQS